ncbi:MAG: hydrogenase maturation protease [Gemmataceae bacterium]
MNLARPIRVIGIGSAHGDDAAGFAAIDRLRELGDWPADISFHTVAGGAGLLDLLDGQGSVVLIDALAPGGNPGAIVRLDWPDPRLQSLRSGSTHQVTPSEALELATTLRLLPTQVVVWGIEAHQASPGAELSPAVRAGLSELIERSAAELRAEDKAARRAGPLG